jgi:hypothetical protein
MIKITEKWVKILNMLDFTYIKKKVVLKLCEREIEQYA